MADHGPPRVLVASCDLDAAFDTSTGLDDDDAQVAAALRAAGADARIAWWDDPDVDWSAADAVLVRSTWNYQDRRDQFIEWARLVGEATTLFPDPDVVRWNTRKSYLMELEDRGVPVVPTAWVGRGDRIDLAALAASRGWSQVVAKPVVGAGSIGLVVARDPAAHQAAFDALVADGDAMVQPLYDRVADLGERSVVVIDGVASHGVRKVPAAGDVRVQVEFGGTYLPWDPDPGIARLAEWIVEAASPGALFARVDMLPADDETWELVELELVEPALFVDWADGAADRLARALLARLG